MRTKALNFQLIFLFTVALANFINLYYGESMPDNLLRISSNESEVSTLGYSFFSFVSLVSYYTGHWFLVPFMIVLFLKKFLFTKREANTDILAPLLLIVFFYFATFTFFPSALGEGLFQLSDETVNIYIAITSTILFGAMIVMVTFRGSVKILWKSVLSIVELMSARVKKAFQKTSIIKEKMKLLPSVESINNSIVSKLKSEDKAEPVTLTEIQRSVPQVEDEIVTSEESQDNSENISPEVPKAKNQTSNRIRNRSSKDNFFNSDDLIDCIKVSNSANKNINPDGQYFQQIQDAIEEKLAEFRISAKIINILKGPVVDTFELELGSGVKVSRVTGLSDDIGLALNGAPIRIVYPMRGKSTIGIEVPRSPREIIYLDEVLKSKAFNDSKHRLPVAMGKDAFGDVSVVDLAAMPHMLVAGSTGAGKSVFVNTLLVSLIIKLSPKQLKLILIDPKQLELALYQDLPHLMLPVITDAKTASIALLWTVQEMERRYSVLKELGVKNIEGFNRKIKNCSAEELSKLNKFYETVDADEYELPYLVVVIDEFADLKLTKSGNEIEDNVNRLAAKARAAGIHLVLATQRPSTDVVTGVIKTNFPTRVAFRVTTATDSRVILDQGGAEKLLGRGDMLYKHGVDINRIHSAFVEEDEIEVLVEKLSTLEKSFDTFAVEFLENGGSEEDSEVTVSMGGAGGFAGSTGDTLYDEAVQIVIEYNQASASMLQRRLKVGYNRAANLIEEMEKNGVVGPQQGSKPRKVLINSQE